MLKKGSSSIYSTNRKVCLVPIEAEVSPDFKGIWSFIYVFPLQVDYKLPLGADLTGKCRVATRLIRIQRKQQKHWDAPFLGQTGVQKKTRPKISIYWMYWPVWSFPSINLQMHCSVNLITYILIFLRPDAGNFQSDWDLFS